MAEGVEDAASLNPLVEMGSDRAQGYYIGRPLPPTELLVWYHRHLSSPAAPRAAAA